jgi:DNA-binding NtrC family response regulator
MYDEVMKQAEPVRAAPEGSPVVVLYATSEGSLSVLGHTLRKTGAEVVHVGHAEELRVRLGQGHVDMVLMDGPRAHHLAGLTAMAAAATTCRAVHCVSEMTPAQIVGLFEQGGHHVLTKPLGDMQRLMELVRRSVARSREEERSGVRPVESALEIAGHSDGVREVRRSVREVACEEVTVLVEGPTGAGKELVARALHVASDRQGAFESVNVGGFTSDMLKSELFGHVRGSHATAFEDRKGYIAMAKGGTLFLDEIGELPLDAQVLLLRLLENGTYRPIGGRETRCDVRIVAATNRDLVQEAHDGGFRQDLYFRLARYRIGVPNLRERVEDIEWLVWHVLAKSGCTETDVSFRPGEFERLEAHGWSGNVRELVNAVGQALLRDEVRSLAPSRHLAEERAPAPTLEALPDAPTETVDVHEGPTWVPVGELERLARLGLSDLKREGSRALARAWLDQILRLYRGNVTRVAEHTGVKSTNLYREFQKLGIDPSDYR